MEGPFEVRNISVSIRRSPKAVYAFITSGESLPRWATGLGDKIQRVGGLDVLQGPVVRREYFQSPEAMHSGERRGAGGSDRGHLGKLATGEWRVTETIGGLAGRMMMENSLGL